MDGKQAYELWSEALRDVGVLLIVFAPLETLLKSGHGTSLDWLVATGVAVLGLLLLWIGVKIETRE